MNFFYDPKIKIWQAIGEKTAPFLHGQLTNHIKQLNSNGEWNYNLLLTQKGKILADLHVARLNEKCFLLLIPQQFEEIVVSHLKKMAPLSRVELTPLTTQRILHLSGQSLPNPDNTELLLQTNRIGTGGWDWFGDESRSHQTWLKENHFTELNEAENEKLRIENGICKVGTDATDENFPQEARLERALHFDKGCYLGQEIVARLQYRGHVNKLLVGLKLDTNKIPTAGTPVILEGKIAGKITSAAFSQKTDSAIALGYVPYGSTDQEFLVGESNNHARIIKLPL